MEGEEWEEWPNSVLTTADRRYLLGEADPEEYANYTAWASKRRRQIKDRLEQSLSDFALVSVSLPVDDSLEVFAPDQGDLTATDIVEGWESMLSIFGRSVSPENIIEMNESGTAAALEDNVAIWQDRHVEVDVDISVKHGESTPLPELYERFKAGGELTDAEVRSLLVAEYISLDDITEGSDSV
jgi:hypothetical protein